MNEFNKLLEATDKKLISGVKVRGSIQTKHTHTHTPAGAASASNTALLTGGTSASTCTT